MKLRKDQKKRITLGIIGVTIASILAGYTGLAAAATKASIPLPIIVFFYPVILGVAAGLLVGFLAYIFIKLDV